MPLVAKPENRCAVCVADRREGFFDQGYLFGFVLDVEAEGMMEAHIKDAVAVCKFSSHLEKEIESGNNWTELSAAKLLSEYRSQQTNSKGISFHPISAFGSNGAIIHYTPTAETDKKITTDGLFMSKFSPAI